MNHPRCINCTTFISPPNVPTTIIRDGAIWGQVHAACALPYMTKARVLWPLRDFNIAA